MTQPRVICIGLANVDVIANVSDDFLLSHGISKGISNILDACSTGTILSTLDNPVCDPGGCAANTACGLASYGVPVRFVGRTGDDGYADMFRQGFDQTTVMFDTPNHPQKMTSVCLTLVTPDKNRSFAFCTDTAGWFVTREDLPEAQDGALVYVEANAGLIQAGGGRSLLEEVTAFYEHAPLFVNLSDPAIVETCRPVLGSLLARAAETWFLGNMAEIRALFETGDDNRAKAMMQASGKNFAVTDGAKGAYILQAGAIHHVPAEPLAHQCIVNTVGAGDQFAAGFMAGLVKDMDCRTACGLGVKAAATVLQQMTARPRNRRMA